jgi:hypothetical protein
MDPTCPYFGSSLYILCFSCMLTVFNKRNIHVVIKDCTSIPVNKKMSHDKIKIFEVSMFWLQRNLEHVTNIVTIN